MIENINIVCAALFSIVVCSTCKILMIGRSVVDAVLIPPGGLVDREAHGCELDDEDSPLRVVVAQGDLSGEEAWEIFVRIEGEA